MVTNGILRWVGVNLSRAPLVAILAQVCVPHESGHDLNRLPWQSSLASPDGITGGRTAPAPAPTMVAAGCGVLAPALGVSIACASGQPLQEVLVAVVPEFLTFSCSSSVTSLTLISVRGCWSSCITLSGIRAPHGSVHAGRVFLWSSQHTPLALGHVYEWSVVSTNGAWRLVPARRVSAARALWAGCLGQWCTASPSRWSKR